MSRELGRCSRPQFSSSQRYNRAVRLISRSYRTSLARLACRAAFVWINASDNGQFSLATSGEGELPRSLAPPGCSVVPDVGANLGGFAVAEAAALPCATVPCFELGFGPRKRLTARFAPSDRFAPSARIGSSAGRVEHESCTTATALASLVRPLPHTHPRVHRGTKGGTGNSYPAKAADLIKVGREGEECLVLADLKRTLARPAIRMAQFDYGRANVASRTLFADMSELLDWNGLVLGRLFTDCVGLALYDLTAKTFRGGNFVAVRRGERALLAAPATRSAQLPVQERAWT